MSQAESVGAEFTPEVPSIESPPAEVLRGSATLPTPTLTLRKLHTKRGVELAAGFSGAGHLSGLNGLLRNVEANPNAAGVVTLRLSLNGAGREALRRARHHRLRSKVTVTFMPSYRGTPALAPTLVTFAAPRRADEAPDGSLPVPARLSRNRWPAHAGLSGLGRHRTPGRMPPSPKVCPPVPPM
jgi:hypothetical protein